MIAAVGRVRPKRRKVEFAGRVDFDEAESDLPRDRARVVNIALRRGRRDCEDPYGGECVKLFRGQKRGLGQKRRVDAARKGDDRRRQTSEVR